MGNVTIPLITNEQNREKQTPEEALFVPSFFDIIAPKKLSTPSLSHRCRISSKNTRKLHMCPLEGEKVLELISLLSVFGRCKATLRPLIRRKKCIVSYQQQSALFLFHGIRLPYRQQLPCSTQLNPRGPNFRSLTRKK